MRNRSTFSRGAIVVAMLAGAALVPAAALGRGGGFAHGGHGAVFGFPRAHIAPHAPLRPAVMHHRPFRFAHGFRRHRFGRHRDGNNNGIADAGYAGGYGYYPGGAYDSGDTTGTVAPYPVWRPPAAPAAEHAGCAATGYDVPGERGGVARVTVTRC